MKLPLVGVLALLAASASCSAPPGASESVGRSISASTSSVPSDAPVSLLRAESVIDGSDLFFFTVLVRSTAADQSVFIHMSVGGGAWSDYGASLLTTIEPGVALWKTEVVPVNPAGVEFVVALTADGVTTWDNNGGANYVLGLNHGPLLNGTNVLLNFAQMTPAVSSITGTPNVFGGIDLRNIAYAKDVTVVWSDDDWQTTHTTAATYQPSYSLNDSAAVVSPNPEGFESWQFGFAFDSQATSAQMAIAYTVDGQTYWDNNFGQNYTVIPSNGPTPGGANGAATGALTLW
ncbi:MAG: hypothetical protein ACLQVI_31530 [Polyangiaceae bacterium]